MPDPGSSLPPAPASSRLRFAPFELNPRTGELFRDGKPVPLQPQPARVLAALASRAGRLVTRSELEDLLWDPDVHLDREQGLNYCIREVRRALGDDSRSPRYVETLPRRGYRFVAEVERIAEVDPGTTGEDVAGGEPEPRVSPALRRWGPPGRWRAIAGAAALLAALGAAALLLGHASGDGPEETVAGEAVPEAAQPEGTGGPAVAGDAAAVPDGTPSYQPQPEALQAYLHVLQLLDQPQLTEDPIPHLERAVELDPDFAAAWATLARRYRIQLPRLDNRMELARRAARRAVTADPGSADGWVELGTVSFFHDYDFAAAGEQFRNALEANPSHGPARQLYGFLLASRGRFGEAREQLAHARRLQPLSLAIRSDQGWVEFFQRDYAAAERIFAAVADGLAHPAGVWPKRGLLGLALVQGDVEQAAGLVTSWVEEEGIYGREAEPLPAEPRAAVESYLRQEIRRVRPWAENQQFPAALLAVNHALLGEEEEALDWLERASGEEAWSWQVPFAGLDPRFDGLRGHPRYEALVDRLGLVTPADLEAVE